MNACEWKLQPAGVLEEPASAGEQRINTGVSPRI